MKPKHDVPKEKQRVNDVLNEAHSRHNIQKHLYHAPLGPIRDRYIRPPQIMSSIVKPGLIH